MAEAVDKAIAVMDQAIEKIEELRREKASFRLHAIEWLHEIAGMAPRRPVEETALRAIDELERLP